MPVTAPKVVEKAKGLSFRIIIVFVLLALVLGSFWLLTDKAVFEQENAFDTTVYAKLSAYASPALTSLFTFLTFFGSSSFLLPAYLLLAAYYLFFKRNTARSLSIAAVGLSGTGVLFLLKQAFHRRRPLEPLLQNVNGFSYPSGHSFSSFTFAGILIYIVWHSNIIKGFKWFWSMLLFVFAFLIALSRVYLHVHFPTDVIAGFFLSWIWLSLCYLVLLRTGKLKLIHQ